MVISLSARNGDSDQQDMVISLAARNGEILMVISLSARNVFSFNQEIVFLNHQEMVMFINKE